MNSICKITFRVLLLSSLCLVMLKTNAQIKIPEIDGLNIPELLGKFRVIKIKKGFSPVFSLGNIQINKVGFLGEKMKGINALGKILNTKEIDQVLKMYKTYKTGLVVFKVLYAAGTAVAVVSAAKGLADENHFNDATVKQMLYPALTSIGVGIITKLITKAASYKAVDIFNGVTKKIIKDIFSIKPASNSVGLGVYVKL